MLNLKRLVVNAMTRLKEVEDVRQRIETDLGKRSG
jgi:hypothetical protein